MLWFHLRPGWLEHFIEDIFEIPVEIMLGELLSEPRPLKNCPVIVVLYYANVGSIENLYFRKYFEFIFGYTLDH